MSPLDNIVVPLFLMALISTVACGADEAPSSAPPVCESLSCEEIDVTCGLVDDGCGGTLSCGACEAPVPKDLPRGVYDSNAGIRSPEDNVASRTPNSPSQAGIMIKIPWGICDDDYVCLGDVIQGQLDTADSLDLDAALVVLDGASAPDSLLSQCDAFNFQFRGEPSQMCLPWNESYQAEKSRMLRYIGARFDDHPRLTYVYFTGACSSNGAEGHCRVDESEYAAAGYTPEKLDDAYEALMREYLVAFPRTPVAFEVHAIFDSARVWEHVWDIAKPSGRVGVAAWWCAERLALNGADTAPVWNLVQEAARETFSVCQTVGSLSGQPYRFTDTSLGLDYGGDPAKGGSFDDSDVHDAFSDTMSWVSGKGHYANMGGNIVPFQVFEAWTQDVGSADFQDRLAEF